MDAAVYKETVQEYRSAGGGRIFSIPLLAFPGLPGFVYLALAQDDHGRPYRALIDTGSGFGSSNDDLLRGFAQASQIAGEPLGPENLTHIFITHGHIDHIGGLNFLRRNSPALVGVHELDRRILTHYEERMAVVSRRMYTFMVEAGVPEKRLPEWMQLYTGIKQFFSSVAVDFTYEQVGMQVGPFRFFHVPGHSAGHVVIRLDEVLFTGDHVLQRTTPHQAPEHLTLSTGLDHYLRSLRALADWASDTRLGLAGHEAPILDLRQRIGEIHELHRRRLDQVLSILSSAHTTAEVSKELFGSVQGYHILLALSEAGAHIEYLYQRGALGIENLTDIRPGCEPVAIRYYRLQAN